MEPSSGTSDAVTTELRRVVEELAALHGCHTVILYGSRARGEARPDSDFDLLLVRRGGPHEREVRDIEGLAIDAWVEDEGSLDVTRDPGLLRVRNGVLIRDEHGFGAELLRRVQEAFARGPAPLPRGERGALRAWGRKMLARIASRSVEGDYRRASLLAELLPIYFQIRGRWYLGPGEGLRRIAAEDPRAWDAFAAALTPGAPDAALARLVEIVLEDAAAGGD